jgi:hypothetical protein
VKEALTCMQVDYVLHPTKRRGGEEIVSSSFMVRHHMYYTTPMPGSWNIAAV